MTDKVAEVLPMQDISEETTTRKLAGKSGVFVGGDDDLAAAQARWEAMKAVEAGNATYEQRMLLQDLDKVLSESREVAAAQAAPPVQAPAPMPVHAPRTVQAPSPAAQRVAPPAGMPAPPRHSRNRR